MELDDDVELGIVAEELDIVVEKLNNAVEELGIVIEELDIVVELDAIAEEPELCCVDEGPMDNMVDKLFIVDELS